MSGIAIHGMCEGNVIWVSPVCLHQMALCRSLWRRGRGNTLPMSCKIC